VGLALKLLYCSEVVKYPPTLITCGDIKWANGVESATRIEPKHDLDILEKIIYGTDE